VPTVSSSALARDCHLNAARQVANAVVAAGIKAILNFSPGRLKVPEGVTLKNADLTMTLEGLSFLLARGDGL
jgi:redox-sensing transcriptional repressor